MPTTRPRVPGWHPDPDDPSALRHWDGKRWGAERRARPSWAAAEPGVDQAGPAARMPPPATRRRRRWAVATAGAVVLALLVALVSSMGRGPDIPPRTVADTSYTERADALCARALPRLRTDRPEAREDTGNEEDLARRVDRAADGLADVVRDLRGIPVAGADGAEIDAWLDDWDRYVTVGRRYATALRQGDRRSQDEAGPAGNRLARRIFLFSQANGMPNCVL